ncbi:type II toxin-antitoxin system Phd/YefM family antitoxin [Sediminibacterium ginsengisoli]|uniref:Antitoxin n=1 Tax=Sediminibacterium ginsengisoli TaxID=413434 RepID=A0A1T4JRS5_9BACT|nr:type II toxin-antitoxin system prevent-host-death family antitoxin [Sediminibacterium ginsengisoli]SJZ32815.1 antitoxin YefM [Sediminibacterium ginsengisoli]
MKVVNYSDLRQNLAHNLNAVNNDREIVVVSRTKGKTVVVMDLEECNAIQETLHLTASHANRSRLEAAIDEMNQNGGNLRQLLED